jgi:ketosteroid isomerase-like protein
MPQGSTTPELLELARRSLEAVNRRDLDTLMSLSAPDAVYDTSPSGLGVYEGQAAIRAFIKGYWDAFEELRFDLEELVDLGNGVTFSVNRQDARPVGSLARVRTREAHVTEWEEGMVVKMTVYTDIDEGRAAAQRLAESRPCGEQNVSRPVVVRHEARTARPRRRD